MEWTQQKTVTIANPVRNAASAPVAQKSQLVEPHQHRDEQGLANETGQRPRASFSSGFWPHNLREAP